MGLQQFWIGLQQCLGGTAAAVLDRIAAVFRRDCNSFG